MADDVTELLHRWKGGDSDAISDLFPVVYTELRRLTRRALSRERSGHTLQPTALVNEAYVLTALARVDARRARVVEMRYFAGMTVPEIAVVLGVPEWDVKKDWTLAKAWLRRHLRESA